MKFLSYSIPSPDIPKTWGSWFQIKAKSVSYVQDVVHVGVKLKSRLFKPSIVLSMGSYVATGQHVRMMQMAFGKDEHGLREKDVNHKDKQNFEAVLRIISASHLVDKIPDAIGTKCYIEVIQCAIDSYLDKGLDHLSRIEKTWYAVFFLRYWRMWILLNPQYTLANNFITHNFANGRMLPIDVVGKENVVLDKVTLQGLFGPFELELLLN
jgi:hypothetical protein